jgi:hypothetical protein
MTHTTQIISWIHLILGVYLLLLKRIHVVLNELLDFTTTIAFLMFQLFYWTFRQSDTHLYLKSSAAYGKGKKIPLDCFHQIDDIRYQCKSQKEISYDDIWYDLDMQSQTCCCKHGFDGKICKHLIGCLIAFNIELFRLPPSMANSWQKLAVIAYGSCENLNFYSFDDTVIPTANDLHMSKDDGSSMTVTQPSNYGEEREQQVFTDSDDNGREQIQKAHLLVSKIF